MTKAEYDKKMAELKEAGSEAYKAWLESDRVRDEAGGTWYDADKAINDLEASWAKQENEAVK